MLRQLAIQNIVLVDRLELEFEPGLGVLTGETGAGKSILLDALGLVLGNRADSGLVRAGEERASVTASFELAAWPRGVRDLLEDADVAIEAGEPLIVKRQVKADGGSKAFVNDQSVGVALLRELAAYLVELHGQHDDRGLVNARGHRALLDRYARADAADGHGDLAEVVAVIAREDGPVVHDVLQRSAGVRGDAPPGSDAIEGGLAEGGFQAAEQGRVEPAEELRRGGAGLEAVPVSDRAASRRDYCS